MTVLGNYTLGCHFGDWIDLPAMRSRCDPDNLRSVRAPAGLGVERPMGLGKVAFGHGRDLRPFEQYVALVVICLRTYDGVRACAQLYRLHTEGDVWRMYSDCSNLIVKASCLLDVRIQAVMYMTACWGFDDLFPFRSLCFAAP